MVSDALNAQQVRITPIAGFSFEIRINFKIFSNLSSSLS